MKIYKRVVHQNEKCAINRLKKYEKAFNGKQELTENMLKYGKDNKEALMEIIKQTDNAIFSFSLSQDTLDFIEEISQIIGLKMSVSLYIRSMVKLIALDEDKFLEFMD